MMAAGVRVYCSISEKAYGLVESGKAVISSGGVRLRDGTMVEMFKPSAKGISLSKVISSIGRAGTKIVGTAATGILSLLGPGGIGIASSLAANVQCAFIQKGVNEANLKLDDVLVRLGRMENALQGLGQIQALSWVNTAFGLANCGISIAGFHMTLTKLDQIGGIIKEFYNRYKSDRDGDKVQEYKNIIGNLEGDMGYLKERQVNGTFSKQGFEYREASIEEHLNAAAALIENVLTMFQEKRINGRIGCQIIFTLGTVFAQTVNEYCCQYYYFHDRLKHHRYDSWIAILDKIDSESFKKHLKMYLAFDAAYAVVSQEAKSAAFHVAMEAVSQLKNRLAVCAQMIREIPEQKYLQLDDILNQEVLTGVAEWKGCAVDEFLNRRLISGEYQIEDDRVLVELA